MQGVKSRSRVVIENVQPEVDAGRFPIKRTVGDNVVVEADVFADGHDEINAVLLYRKGEGGGPWSSVPMTPLGNDRWTARFTVQAVGLYAYTVRGWIDHFKTWRRDLRKRLQAGQDVSVELLVGVELVQRAAQRAEDADAEKLRAVVQTFTETALRDEQVQVLLDDEVFRLVSLYPDLRLATSYGRELAVVVDREKARFGAWYEMFPRSCAAEPGRHGTFKDLEGRLSYVAGMGFDVLYLPPLHPIGSQYRKGKNNAVSAKPDDVGSPWGIGAVEGGHKAVHPNLGTIEDFRRLIARARDYDIEIAIDVAFQCSADHPWVKAHSEWFRKRPDGTIQYAENPPKKYQDIYPIDFESEDGESLWDELKSVFLFWCDQGVRIFRVDNPHTKAFGFWEWCIGEVKKEHPDTIFLAEAFTRPKVMYRLAKLGFTQSYTYFAWRNTKHELMQYLTELTQTPVKEFFRPNFWPNTPDILTEHLQHGGRPAFMGRLVLAATLAASYGIYGPAFELCVNRPREQGSEEYLDSEKYEIKHWHLDDPEGLHDFIARVNGIRRTNPALASNERLRFHPINNDQMLCYSKTTDDLSNVIVVVVNLDPYHTQAGWVELPLDQLGLDWHQPYQLHELLGEARYLWQGPRNYVELNPQVVPAHVFRIRRRVRTERDFEYYL
ncbi:MAG: alpha-1,4-glucan--maltose-1-phosphate maltosyltransferase [Planctomycetes bacterium]|nr:alpha-1,4-glucan--maltose-1-phosphate maltosyltransferase [Planctomycetota bacterium]